MIDPKLNDALERFIAAEEQNMIRDTIGLIAIKSLKTDPTPGHPFGDAIAKSLDHALELAESYGFATDNKGYSYGSCLHKGSKGDKELAMVCHLDIVPAEEDNWKRPPFEGYVENGYIVGRGSTDNKGPLVAALYVLRFFKEQNIEIGSDLRLIFGCDEESGSQDMIDYVKQEPRLPAFTLVPDGPFPICYAEKGRLEFTGTADLTGGNLVSFEAGEVANTTPGLATAEVDAAAPKEILEALNSQDGIAAQQVGGTVKVTAKGLSKHTSTPEGAVDAAHKLADALNDSGLLTGAAVRVIASLARFTSDHYGAAFGIAVEDDILGKLTHSCSLIRTDNQKLTLSCDVRYPIRAKFEVMHAEIQRSLADGGYTLQSIEDNPPNYMPKDDPIAKELCAIANEQMGTDLAPATMGGGTYARKLPNAVAYGPSRPDIKKPFPPGHGWAHQVDEGVRIQNLTDMIRAYVPALLYLDKTL